jgi:hypothetical protein
MASESIERTEWKTFWPDAPGAADVPMPEYLTPRDCSRELAQQVSGLLSQPEELERRRDWLGRLKQQFAIPGASARAAELILDRLGGKSAIRRVA